MVRVEARRSWSLRREWMRAFAIMLMLFLVAGIGTVTGVRQLVGEFSKTADRLERQTAIVTSLEGALVVHWNAAHQLVNGTPPMETAGTAATFLAAQRAISVRFGLAAGAFPSDGASSELLTEARTAWQTSLTKAGLWENEIAAFVPPPKHVARYEEIQDGLAAGDQVVQDFLDALEKTSLHALQHGMAFDNELERVLTGALVALFGLVLGATVYFRHRMARDLLRPVASLREGVTKLHAGEYQHHIPVARRDELGELAEAFNSMASALSESHRELTFRATHDHLTGMPNRAVLTDRLAASFTPSDRRRHAESVLFIDIDDFKDVNDSFGHEGGDTLLIQLVTRLSGCVRPQDLLARLGGDEFAIVLVEGDGITAVDVAERVLEALRVPFDVNGTQLVISVSIGIARREPNTADASQLLREADFSMYMAKRGGKDQYQLFEPGYTTGPSAARS